MDYGTVHAGQPRYLPYYVVRSGEALLVRRKLELY